MNYSKFLCHALVAAAMAAWMAAPAAVAESESPEVSFATGITPSPDSYTAQPVSATFMIAQSEPDIATKRARRIKDRKMTFELPDLDGNTVSWDDKRFKDKVVIVDLWGTWCLPCLKAIPELNRFHEEYHEKGLEIVGIAFESDSDFEQQREKLKAFAKEHGIEYTILFGGSSDEVRDKLPALQNFVSFPTTVFSNRDGKAVRVEVGFEESMAPKMESVIQELLDQK